jgi:cytosol aminopeptidase family protein
MIKASGRRLIALLVVIVSALCMIQQNPARAQTAAMQSKPAEIPARNTTIATRVLVQSPAETDTELQIICLFQSLPTNTLHGSLLETNAKLKGLLDKLRNPTLFRGELGETILIVPPAGSLTARKLLIIGLGDSQTFTPQRLELVGSIAYNESYRLGIAHPFFAPTILDGGVTNFPTGQVSEEFLTGFLRAARSEKLLEAAGASTESVVKDITFLAGPSHAADTQQGIERALAAAGEVGDRLK